MAQNLKEEDEAEEGCWSSSIERANVFSQWQMVRWAKSWWKILSSQLSALSLFFALKNKCMWRNATELEGGSDAAWFVGNVFLILSDTRTKCQLRWSSLPPTNILAKEQNSNICIPFANTLMNGLSNQIIPGLFNYNCQSNLRMICWDKYLTQTFMMFKLSFFLKLSVSVWQYRA